MGRVPFVNDYPKCDSRCKRYDSHGHSRATTKVSSAFRIEDPIQSSDTKKISDGNSHTRPSPVLSTWQEVHDKPGHYVV